MLKDGSILQVVKPLYSVPKASNHWFNIYHSYYIEKLYMNQSIYNPYLLYTSSNSGFGIIGIQMDNTLILYNNTFVTNEANELKRAQFLSKEREQLT